MILGIDEVGRGPWAGPLVIGAVVLGDAKIDGLTDSKKLTKKRREELNGIIKRDVASYGLGWVHADELDKVGLSAALVLATKRAVEQVNAPYNEIIIDGTINFLKDTSKGKYVTTLKKADLLIPSVSAASIIAKVARDDFMAEQDSIYPEYKFGSHVGYGTAAHRAAIDIHGVTPLHRLSFAPLRKYKTEMVDTVRIDTSVGATSDRKDEAVMDIAVRYVEFQGHEVMMRKWKTEFCEIDIVSKHNNALYFTEVNYRKGNNQGGGPSAITARKHRHMKMAAEHYAKNTHHMNADLRLAAIDIGGQPPVVQSYLKLG
jgi:ribonuclease HII